MHFQYTPQTTSFEALGRLTVQIPSNLHNINSILLSPITAPCIYTSSTIPYPVGTICDGPCHHYRACSDKDELKVYNIVYTQTMYRQCIQYVLQCIIWPAVSWFIHLSVIVHFFSSVAHVWVPGAKTTGPIVKK
jgi:hypothetical protein